MPSFFIEMGQGIIAPPELRVTTSALHNCTLIAGHNRESGYGGAYHYPSGNRQNNMVLGYMSKWADVLKPTHVTLIFAKNPEGMGRPLNTSEEDVVFLSRWVRQSCNTEPVAASEVGPGVLVGVNGVFRTGKVVDLPGNFDAGKIKVDRLHAGDYMLNENYRYTIIGENLEMLRG